MIRAILFDLDGTLLDNDINSFLGPYMKRLTAHLRDLGPAETVARQVMAATQAMMAHADTRLTNQQVFLEHFLPAIGLSREQAMPRFDAFYETEFPKLRSLTKPRPDARPTVELAIAQGYRVVIATNPVFPRRAVDHRLEWAGVIDLPFDLVTSYENMHACKPKPAYYREIAERLDVSPAECMMVCDSADDMAAAEAGMSTFHVTYGTPGSGPQPACDYAGTLVDLQHLLVSAGGAT